MNCSKMEFWHQITPRNPNGDGESGGNEGLVRAIGVSIHRGQPFGSDDGKLRTVKKNGVGSTIRPLADRGGKK